MPGECATRHYPRVRGRVIANPSYPGTDHSYPSRGLYDYSRGMGTLSPAWVRGTISDSHGARAGEKTPNTPKEAHDDTR